MTVFIALILISSVIGFLYIPEQDSSSGTFSGSKRYNNIEFFQGQNNKWIAAVNNQQYLFDYLPEELSTITIPQIYILNNPKLYIIFNASERNQEYLLQKLEYNLRTLGKTVVQACLTETDCPDIPVKDCTEPGILLRESRENRVYLYESCIAIEGDTLYQSQAIDKLHQALLGI